MTKEQIVNVAINGYATHQDISIGEWLKARELVATQPDLKKIKNRVIGSIGYIKG